MRVERGENALLGKAGRANASAPSRWRASAREVRAVAECVSTCSVPAASVSRLADESPRTHAACSKPSSRRFETTRAVFRRSPPLRRLGRGPPVDCRLDPKAEREGQTRREPSARDSRSMTFSSRPAPRMSSRADLRTTDPRRLQHPDRLVGRTTEHQTAICRPRTAASASSIATSRCCQPGRGSRQGQAFRVRHDRRPSRCGPSSGFARRSR